jgi:sugar (pentulose or hexulose) kinase
MGTYLGIDLGSTTLSAVVIDVATGEMLTHDTIANEAEITSSPDRERGRSEWDIERMLAAALGLIRRLCEGRCIDAVGVTGQQHGMVLVNERGVPQSPFIGWQDQRCNEPLPDGATTIHLMLERGGSLFARSGCTLATGYLASTLFWLSERGALPPGASACFAPDMLVSRLCGQPPLTDPTLAASAGVFDVARGEWNRELIAALGLPISCFPPVRPPCTQAGTLSPEAAQQTGLAAGTPVAVPCGDNQASFAGSVADPARSVLVNIGTGGQTSVFVERPLLVPTLDLRPFLQPGFLLVGAGLAGGRSYRMMRDFIREVGETLFSCGDGLTSPPTDEDLYDRLAELAAQAPPGADGLICEPIFAGTRREPERRAVWRGMSEASFRPGHMARALLEGLAEQYCLLYRQMLDAGAGPRERLIGSGNGLRKNALLRGILAAKVRLPLQSPVHTEEAAVGAALTAAVAVGEFANLAFAGQAFIRYRGEC